MSRNRQYKFIFRQPDTDFTTQADCIRDALAIALEQTGVPSEALVEIQQPDPDDPYNPEATVSLRGAALDLWL